MAGYPGARIVLALLLLTPARLVAAAPEISTSPSLDLPAYAQELERLDAAVSALATQPETWDHTRKSLAPAWSVDAEGQRFEVSNRWLGDALKQFGANPQERERLRRNMRARLAMLHDEAAELLQHSRNVSDVRAAQRLSIILGRREFQTASSNNVWQRIQAAVSEWLTRLLERIFGSVAGRPWAGRLLMWLAIAAAFVFIVILLRNLWMQPSPERVLVPDELPGSLEDSSVWRRRTMAASSDGDYTEAVRCAYWLAIAWLGEAEAWRPDSTRTPREYLLLVPALHFRSEPLAALTRRFEEVWYRSQSGTRDQFQDALAQLEALGCPPLASATTEIS